MIGMGLTYFKRYRMEIDLGAWDGVLTTVPTGYRLLTWDVSLLEYHAQVKHLSFRDEIDANVFTCFNDLNGCRRLMREIVQKPGFLPGATWLAVYTGGPRTEYCGTIQGVCDRQGMGAVQNVGIIPRHRGRGLGTALLFHALDGFRDVGIKRVHLEVTADNQGAIRLYHRLGFTTVKTVFKAAEVGYSLNPSMNQDYGRQRFQAAPTTWRRRPV